MVVVFIVVRVWDWFVICVFFRFIENFGVVRGLGVIIYGVCGVVIGNLDMFIVWFFVY